MPAASKSQRAREEALDAALRALADSTRRRIMASLVDEEYAAGEIAAWFPSMSRPAVSQHLAVLERAELVQVRHEGNRRLYRAHPEGLDDVRQYLAQFWPDALGRLKRAAERAQAAKRAAR